MEEIFDVKQIVAEVVPMGAPRMTQRDRWKKRPCVLRYHAFKDALRAQVGPVPDGVNSLSWIAYMPIPKSWPKWKKKDMAGKLHDQKPDRDNIDKAILDALFKDDRKVATGRLTKRWDDGNGPRIHLTLERIPE